MTGKAELGMKGGKWLPAFAAGLILAFVIMAARGIFSAGTFSQGLLCACDGFSVSGILFLGVGAMSRIAGEGAFDMLGYAVRKGLHHIIPGKFGEDGETFYDYKANKPERKKNSLNKDILITGTVDFVIGLLLIAVWYCVSGDYVI